MIPQVLSVYLQDKVGGVALLLYLCFPGEVPLLALHMWMSLSQLPQQSLLGDWLCFLNIWQGIFAALIYILSVDCKEHLFPFLRSIYASFLPTLFFSIFIWTWISSWSTRSLKGWWCDQICLLESSPFAEALRVGWMNTKERSTVHFLSSREVVRAETKALEWRGRYL